MQSHSKSNRTSLPLTHNLSRNRLKSQSQPLKKASQSQLTRNTAHRKLPTPPPLNRTSTPTKLTPISTPTSQSQSSDFLYENQSPLSVNPITLSSQSQDPNMSEVQPTRSEMDVLDDNNMEMETDPLSASITQINLSGILNRTIRETSSNQSQDTPTPMGQSVQLSFIESKGKRLKAALTIITKASHHKAFMETYFMRNSPPKNMSLWVQPHIYHLNEKIEKQWKDTLHTASLDLTSALIQHYTRVIQTEQQTLEEIKQEITQYLLHKQGIDRDEAIKTWKELSRKAEEEARSLSESLKESRETSYSESANAQKAHQTYQQASKLNYITRHSWKH